MKEHTDVSGGQNGEIQMAPVIIIDDTPADVAALASALRDIDDMEVTVFEDAREGLTHVMGMNEPPVMVVDHDLSYGQDFVGYDLVQGVREQHPYGLLIPIIYYSGRQNLEEYSAATLEKLSFAPTAFVRKGTDASIRDGVRDAQTMLAQVLALAARQSAAQAVLDNTADEWTDDWDIDAFDEGDDDE